MVIIGQVVDLVWSSHLVSLFESDYLRIFEKENMSDSKMNFKSFKLLRYDKARKCNLHLRSLKLAQHKARKKSVSFCGGGLVSVYQLTLLLIVRESCKGETGFGIYTHVQQLLWLLLQKIT